MLNKTRLYRKFPVQFLYVRVQFVDPFKSYDSQNKRFRLYRHKNSIFRAASMTMDLSFLNYAICYLVVYKGVRNEDLWKKLITNNNGKTIVLTLFYTVV